MSVILLGDGSLTSSKAIFGSPLTLPDPAPSQHIVRDNVDVIEGDGGFSVMYEKGTYRRIFPYRFTLLSESMKDQIDRWWKDMSGRLNWFTLQPQEQPITSSFLQQGTDSTSKITNSALNFSQLTHWWRGYWVIALTGSAAGQRRKIYNSWGDPYGDIYCYAFDNNIATGDEVILGYPVVLDEDSIIYIPRLPNFWDVQIVFKEKVIS